MNEIPETEYDYEVGIIRKYFEDSLREIELTLMGLAASSFTTAQAIATIAEIKLILKLLDDNVKDWTKIYLEQAVKDGVARSIYSQGLTSTYKEAQEIVKFSRLNRELVKAAVADTQSDLLQVTQNVERRTRIAIREATAHSMRSNMTQGVVAVRSIQGDILQSLDAATKNGIIDAAGRRWKPEVYTEMVARTKLFSAQREGTMNDAAERGILYVRVSAHGAKDACRFYEGKILKLVPDAPGDFTYIGSIPRRDLFHPNCKHRLTPVRNPFRELDDE